MIDYTKLINQIDPKPGGEDKLRIRTGVINAINANGTVNVTISNIVIPNVPRLESVSVVVGQSVQVITYLGALLVLGPVAANDGDWTAWTPTWTSSGTQPVLGNGTLTGRYRQDRKTVTATFRLLMGSTTTYGTGTWTFSVPVPVMNTASHLWVGSGYYRDSSAAASGHYFGSVIAGPLGVNALGAAFTVPGPGVVIGPTAPFTWANTDFLHWTVTYEAA